MMARHGLVARIVFAMAATGLVLAVAVLIWAGVTNDASAVEAMLPRIPLSIDGWMGTDLPLGETELLRAGVAKLNYDDYVYRVYRKEGREVFVYAMVWRQGRISVREIAGHMPDGCWVANGAQLTRPPGTATFELGGHKTIPAEVRRFLFSPGLEVNVAWWHLWDREKVDVDYGAKSPFTIMREISDWLGHRRGRHVVQLVVRIHGREGMGELVGTPPVQSFLALLPLAESKKI